MFIWINISIFVWVHRGYYIDLDGCITFIDDLICRNVL